MRVGRDAAVGEIRRELVNLGGSVDTDPVEAITSMIREAAANVAVYRLVVQANADEGIVALYDAERERLVRFSDIALRAGVELRRVELLHDQATLMARALDAALDAGGLDAAARVVALDAAAAVLRGADA